MKQGNHPNYRRWLKPPTIEQIDAVIKAAGVPPAQFERFHGIHKGCLRKVRCGERDMPVQFWHLFLDDTKPVAPKSVPRHRPKPINPAQLKRTNLVSSSHLSKLVF